MLGHAVREELAALSLSALLGLRPGVGQVVVLVGLGGGAGQRAALAERVAEAFRAAVRRVGVHECGPVVVGSPSSWAEAGAELRHATQAAQAAHHLPPRSWFDARALDVDALLWVLRDHESLRAFVARTLGPLLQPEDRRLVATLEVFCRLGGRKTEVARDLGVNRQSLYSRLARIETLLGTDLTDPETILTLHLAFRARRTLGTAHETPRAD